MIKQIRLTRQRNGATEPGVGVVKTSTYGKSLAYVKELAKAAREIFPDLKDENIQIVFFGGDRYKRQCGIEFPADTTIVPEGWQEISELEMLL